MENQDCIIRFSEDGKLVQEWILPSMKRAEQAAAIVGDRLAIPVQVMPKKWVNLAS